MPYIKKENRSILKSVTTALENNPPITAGDLNYIITTACLCFLKKNLIINYQSYNDVIGALESSKLEMYRRSIAPYEDTKITENGDVYV
jgi:hypothetical protein